MWTNCTLTRTKMLNNTTNQSRIIQMFEEIKRSPRK